MRGSKLSTLQSSKLSTKLIEQSCRQHDGQSFTNFCSAMTCIKPLCPQCIQSHYKHHKNIRTQPQIDSFKSLKNKCVGKVGQVLQHIGNNENEFTVNELATIKKVREARERTRKILEAYFGNLEEFLKNKLSKITSQDSELFLQLDKASNIINELKLLCNKLQNPKTFLQAAETIVKLDTGKLQQKIHEGQNSVKRYQQTHKGLLVVQKGYENKLYQFLSSTFYYGNKENLETMPKVVEQMLVEDHVKQIGREDGTLYRDESRYSSRGIGGSRVALNVKTANTSRATARQDSSYERGASQSNLEQIYREANKPPSMQNSSNREIVNQSQTRPRSRQARDDKSTMSRHSSRKTIRGPKRQIIGMNTFQANATRKYLHFFEPSQNFLHYIDLDQGQKFVPIPININFQLPTFHKSIAISNGDLYLIGGSLATSSVKSQKIYKFDFDKNTLTYCCSLKYGRSSHSVCFNNRYIYVLGGFLSNQILTNRCERYDVVNNKVEEIRPMHFQMGSFACCAFAGRYVYVFGGLEHDDNGLHIVSLGLFQERYDEMVGQWEIVKPGYEVKGQQLMQVSTAAAVQITKNQILVFGGYDDKNVGQKQSYVLRIEQDGSTTITDVNAYQLPFGEGFWNNNAVVHMKLVFALQNVAQGQSDQCSNNMRKILSFDGQRWKSLN